MAPSFGAGLQPVGAVSVGFALLSSSGAAAALAASFARVSRRRREQLVAVAAAPLALLFAISLGLGNYVGAAALGFTLLGLLAAAWLTARNVISRWHLLPTVASALFLTAGVASAISAAFDRSTPPAGWAEVALLLGSAGALLLGERLGTPRARLAAALFAAFAIQGAVTRFVLTQEWLAILYLAGLGLFLLVRAAEKPTLRALALALLAVAASSGLLQVAGSVWQLIGVGGGIASPGAGDLLGDLALVPLAVGWFLHLRAPLRVDGSPIARWGRSSNAAIVAIALMLAALPYQLAAPSGGALKDTLGGPYMPALLVLGFACLLLAMPRMSRTVVGPLLVGLGSGALAIVLDRTLSVDRLHGDPHAALAFAAFAFAIALNGVIRAQEGPIGGRIYAALAGPLALLLVLSSVSSIALRQIALRETVGLETAGIFAAAELSLATLFIAYLAITIVSGSLLTITITRPLALLLATLNRQRRGVSSARSRLTQADEIGVLGRALDAATDETQLQYAMRHEAETGMERAEGRFAQLFRASPAPVLISSAGDNRIVDANDAFVMLFGFSRDELIGRTSLELGILDSEGSLAASTALVDAQGRLSSIEALRYRRDGKPLTVLISSEPIDLEGMPCRLSTMVDITERTEAETAARQLAVAVTLNAERNRFFALSTDLLCSVGLDGCFDRVNPAFHQLLGWTSAELLARPFLEFVHPDDVVATRAAVAPLASGATHASATHRFRTKSGSYRDLQWNVTQRPGDEMYYASARDITEGLAIHNALQRSEELTRAVLATAADGIVVIDDAGAIQSFNPAAELMSGWTSAEVVGRSFGGLLTEPSRLAFEGYLRDFLATGERALVPIVREVEGLRKDGTSFPLGVTTSGMRLGDRHLFVAIVRDISVEKAAQHATELASRSKSEFLANMSHELRTPLNAILGFSELLEERAGTALDERQRGWLRNIQTGGTHLLALINDVLDISKVEAGRYENRPELVSLPDLLVPVLATMRLDAEARGLVFDASDAPATTVLLDPLRTRQVLHNILSNAAKFTERGGRVRLDTEISGDDLRFVVSDSGIGIPVGDHDRVFGVFERLHRDRLAMSGTGLGLALTKRIVELQGGSITFTSEVGVGTTFTVILPGAVHAEVHGPRVLIVDDDPRDAALIAELATESHLQVEIVTTGAAALAAVRRDPPTAVILDLRLPDMRGEAVLEALRADGVTPGIPVIVVTVEDDDGRTRLLGAADHLTKPLDRARLHRWLRRVGGHVALVA